MHGRYPTRDELAGFLAAKPDPVRAACRLGRLRLRFDRVLLMSLPDPSSLPALDWTG